MGRSGKGYNTNSLGHVAGNSQTLVCVCVCLCLFLFLCLFFCLCVSSEAAAQVQHVKDLQAQIAKVGGCFILEALEEKKCFFF